MADRRAKADITRVEKRGDGYEVTGVADGVKASFYVDATSFESHPNKSEFMRRHIRSMVERKKEE